ncbi:hypothetical protein NQ317_018842 [Molorchus minor]|uniref:Uncharacterized protein n=1 Tax=Molorchus minor TaxID=1323400 RepID=A0ABQ9J5T0_9CUCU|nr:hypothetical protein NQ317_018842 [Molorchus minor]
MCNIFWLLLLACVVVSMSASRNEVSSTSVDFVVHRSLAEVVMEVSEAHMEDLEAVEVDLEVGVDLEAEEALEVFTEAVLLSHPISPEGGWAIGEIRSLVFN